MLERIVYVSRAAAGLVLEDVFAIIRTAHLHNPPARITGGMVALDGWFMQVLEGPAAALGPAFARIAADPRHRDLDIRIRMSSAGRLFSGQPMALRQRPHISETLLASYEYSPGFPVTAFPVDVLTGFRRRGLPRRLAPAGGAGRGPGARPGQRSGSGVRRAGLASGAQPAPLSAQGRAGMADGRPRCRATGR